MDLNLGHKIAERELLRQSIWLNSAVTLALLKVDALSSLCQNGGREGGLYLVKASQSGGMWPTLCGGKVQTILTNMQNGATEEKNPPVGPTLRSYAPACGLLEAGLQDTLTLQVKRATAGSDR